MSRSVRRLVVIVSLILSVLPAATVWADSRYVVQPGDTLTRIAARFGVSVPALAAANNLADANQIQVGQTLTIPDGAPTAPAAASQSSRYVVKPGDSLARLSARLGVSMDALIQANQLTSTTLQIGQVLVIPASSAPAPAGVYARVSGSAVFVRRMTEALDWLQAQDPEAFARVEAYVASIAVSPYRTRAYARALADGCAVRALARADMSTPLVAALLYHEATHCQQFATLGRLDTQTAEVQAYSAQIDFMQRHGFPDDEITYFQAILAYYADQPADGRYIPPPSF